MSGTILAATRSVGQTAYQLAFEISPVVLCGGIAQRFGGFLPIVSLTEEANFATGLLSGGTSALSLDNFLCHWKPMPGATLQNNDFGRYPFANQSVAANAVIVQPLTVSMLMLCPARTEGGYLAKLGQFIALKIAIDNHVAAGGTFAVLTPTYLYLDCILTGLRDISGGESKQPSIMWQWDFEQPLISLAAAAGAQANNIAAMTNGTQTDGATSGAAYAANQQPGGLVVSTVPAAQNLPAASVPSVPVLTGGN